jgi:Uma2 family endonuclease
MSTARITWQDAQLMPEDCKRYEAIEGELYVTPAPSFRHQRVSLKLALALHRLLEEPGHGIIAAAPVGVEFAESQEGVQPDLIFVSNARRRRVAEEGIRGAPDLVVEILSPGTAERDRTVKKKLYQRQGVAQYWIVDPDGDSVEVWDWHSEPGRNPARRNLRAGQVRSQPNRLASPCSQRLARLHHPERAAALDLETRPVYGT